MRGWVLAVSVGLVLLVGACAPALPPSGPTQAPATQSPTPRIGLTRAEAVAIARVAAQAPPDWDVLQADAGWPGQVDVLESPTLATPGLGFVWRINIGFIDGPLDGQGVIVVLDYFDGHVISKTHWIS